MTIYKQLWKSSFRLFRVRNFKIKNVGLKFVHMANLGLITVHCQSLSDVKDLNNSLTHEACIKQACMISANSATTLLTTATTAILDVCNRYKNSLDSLLRLYEELLLTRGEMSETWETMVESRGEVDKMKAAVSEMNSYMSSVEKVVTSTTEAAFLAGADYLCTVLCERLYSAQQEINKTMSEIKKLEDEFLKLEEEVAKTINKKEK